MLMQSRIGPTVGAPSSVFMSVFRHSDSVNSHVYAAAGRYVQNHEFACALALS